MNHRTILASLMGTLGTMLVSLILATKGLTLFGALATVTGFWLIAISVGLFFTPYKE